MRFRICPKIDWTFFRCGFWVRLRRDDDRVLAVRQGGATKGCPKKPSTNVQAIFGQILVPFLSVFLLFSCGHASLNEHAIARDHFLGQNYAEAENDLHSPPVLSDQKNRLLTLMELGTIAHYEGLYEKSNFYFFHAKDAFRQLYTSSFRESLATGLLNDNSSSYTGMDYEVSLVHFYITANFLALSHSTRTPTWSQPALQAEGKEVLPAMGSAEKTLSNKEQVDFLGQARSELRDWNSFLQEVRESNRGEPYYKDDLLNKIFAAFIHRNIGSSEDRGIAEVLNRDASDVLVKAYSAYPTFNEKWQQFIDNYKKFPHLGVSGVKAQYITPTNHYIDVENTVAAQAKTPGNTMVVLEDGVIPRRQEKHFVIGLSTLMGQISDPNLRRQVEQIGLQALISMAPVFGLTVASATVVGAVTSEDGKPKYMSEAMDSAIGFEFKLPNLEPYAPTENRQIHFHPSSGGAEIAVPVTVLSPLGDIAKLNVERRAGAVAFKTGVRVGLKYLAALVPAVMLYKGMNGKPEFLRVLAAAATWMAAKKVVDATESADLRSWELLPRWIGGIEANLAPGTYGISVTDAAGKEFPAGNITVNPGQFAYQKIRVFPDGRLSF